MEVLAQQSEGAFMVRQSSSNPGSYALTMKAPNGKILNYLIDHVPGGYRLQVSVWWWCWGGGGGGEGGLALFTSSVWEVGSIECSMAGKGVWHFPGYKFCELFKSRTVSVLNLATVDSRCV